MGILLQIYFFFPWIHIDGGYHTIHVYLIEVFRKGSCIKAYNYIFLSGHPILWKYSGFAAVTFTMIIAFMIVMQMIELWQLSPACIEKIRSGERLGRTAPVSE